MDENAEEYLKNFKNLLDEGLITQQEYEAKKVELLSTTSSADPSSSPQNTKTMLKSSVQIQDAKKEERNLGLMIGNAIMIGVGVLVFVFGGVDVNLLTGLSNMTFQGDFYTYEYKATVYAYEAIVQLVRATTKIAGVLGALMICVGLKGLLGELLKPKSK